MNSRQEKQAYLTLSPYPRRSTSHLLKFREPNAWRAGDSIAGSARRAIGRREHPPTALPAASSTWWHAQQHMKQRGLAAAGDGDPVNQRACRFFVFTHGRNRTSTRNPAVHRAIPAETLSFLQSRRARASRGGLVSLEHSARGRTSTLGNLLEPSGH